MRWVVAALSIALSCLPRVALADGEADIAACGDAEDRGDYETAIALCTRGLQAKDLPPHVLPIGLNMRAFAYYRGKQYERAIQDYDQAIKLDPGTDNHFFMRGRTFAAIGDHAKAIADFDAAIKINAREPEYFYNRGLAYAGNGDADRAIADYTSAIALSPQAAHYYYDRGGAYDYRGDYEHAIADYDAAIRLDPNFLLAYIARGITLRAAGRVDEAIRDYDQALKINPGIVDVYTNRGNAYRAKGDYDRAIQDFDLAIKLDAKDARHFNNRAGAYSDKGDTDHAIADYTRAIELDPGMAVAYMDRAQQFNFKGLFDKAIADAEAGQRLDPEDSTSWWAKGAAEFGLGRHEAAAGTLAAYVAMEPDDPYGVLLLYLSQARAGQDARSTLRANAAHLDPSHWPNEIVEYLLGDRPEQKVSINIGTPDGVCDYQFYLGQAAVAQGRVEDARRLLELASEDCRPTLVERALAAAELSRL